MPGRGSSWPACLSCCEESPLMGKLRASTKLLLSSNYCSCSLTSLYFTLSSDQLMPHRGELKLLWHHPRNKEEAGQWCSFVFLKTAREDHILLLAGEMQTEGLVFLWINEGFFLIIIEYWFWWKPSLGIPSLPRTKTSNWTLMTSEAIGTISGCICSSGHSSPSAILTILS